MEDGKKVLLVAANSKTPPPKFAKSSSIQDGIDLSFLSEISEDSEKPKTHREVRERSNSVSDFRKKVSKKLNDALSPRNKRPEGVNLEGITLRGDGSLRGKAKARTLR
eukprot:TRINITY_DN11557_c0_g1_i1.p1 TRINITY_DN11557_c0_g1~~TRINITY_DN11557_c0_g1_i1.p1  ORF type:complete len:108 (+),score=21.39 TRINITY_DN11557_c0_g1_i1:119-442(+)